MTLTAEMGAAGEQVSVARAGAAADATLGVLRHYLPDRGLL
jgi:hypothetical protein